MRRRLIIGSLVLALLAGTLLFLGVFGRSQPYVAESLLVVRPFNQALLHPSFAREVMKRSHGLAVVGLQDSTYTSTTSQGTTIETNGVVRLVVAGATAAEAERLASEASEGIRLLLQQLYGIAATPLDRVRGAPSSALHEPFKLRFGDATPGPFPTAGPVYFPTTEISIEPGEGWMRWYVVDGGPAGDSQLVLHGKMASIRTYPLDLALTSAEAGVTQLHDQIARRQRIIGSSYKKDPFVTVNGMHGVHASFTRQPPGGAPSSPVKTHYYVVTNTSARCIVLECDTIAAGDSEELQRMIQKTLRVP